MNNTPLPPRIILLGTGGTIASTAPDAATLSDYTVTEGVDSLLAAVPGLGALARIECQQVFNVDSRAITDRMLIRLARQVDKLLADPAIDGVVVTHGTDTLEETAYFLNLTVKSRKPVVIVGAMRPGSAISADGPLNLYNAIFLAAHREAAGHGVLVLLNDRVHAARFISKTNTTQADAFDSPEQGNLGLVHNNQLHLFQTPTRAHTLATDFRLAGLKKLPWVDIVYDHQNAGLHQYKASIEAGAQGIVVAACGNGSLSPQAEKGLRLAARHKIVCVRSSRVGSGLVTKSASDVRRGLVSGNSLNPQKARILLMLALTQTADRARIQSYFDRY